MFNSDVTTRFIAPFSRRVAGGPHGPNPALPTLGIPMVIAAMLLLSGICRGQDVATNSPRLACDQPAHEFGSVDNRKSVERTFILKNEGAAPLVITKIHGCCGASTRLGQPTIAPGTNTTLDISLSLKGRKGKVNKSFYVHSNDPQNPIFQLRMIGACIPAGTNAVEVKERSRSGKGAP